MNDLVQWVAIVISVGLLLLVVELVRRRVLVEEYAFIWLLGAVTILSLSIWRRSLDFIARWLGVYYPPAVLLLLLTLFGFVVGLYLSIVVSRQRRQIERLVEELAILSADVQELRERAVRPSGTRVS